MVLNCGRTTAEKTGPWPQAQRILHRKIRTVTFLNWPLVPQRMSEPFLQEIRATLETVTTYWKSLGNKEPKELRLQALERVLERESKLKSGYPQRELLFYHSVGREYKDEFVDKTAQELLFSFRPELEDRLPWYEAMHIILTKGEWVVEEKRPAYFLNSNDKEQIIAGLQGRDAFFRQLPPDLQRFYTLSLAIDLAATPGRKLNTLNLPAMETPQRLLTIWHCLHLPWGTVDDTKETASSAELNYAKIQRRLENERGRRTGMIRIG